jgi:acyl carrier protein
MNNEMLEFLISEIREIRPALPAAWPLDARFMADMHLDSLDLVELVARIEQRYGILVPDADLQKFISLDATLNYIVEHIDG